MKASTLRDSLFTRWKRRPVRPTRLDPADMGAEFGLHLRLERQAEEALHAPQRASHGRRSGSGWLPMLQRRRA